MRLVREEGDGSVRYGYPAGWVNRTAGDRLILSVSAARVGAPETAWYVAYVGRALDTPDGRFLFHFTAQDLADRGGRIIATYRGPVAEANLIGARYTAFDAEDQLWFRGAVVHPAFRGRGLGPAMAVAALLDWSRKGYRVVRGTCAVIVDADGRPNPNSVAALAKIGFRLGDREDVVALTGGHRDRHLLPWATMTADGPVTRYRRMYLDRDGMLMAKAFLDCWYG